MVQISCKNPQSELGYKAHSKLYQATDCSRCPFRKECHNAEENRIIRVNHALNEYKRTVRELLTSERGMFHRSRRPIEPESVFGHIKAGHLFRRFHLRSLAKVNIEFGLVALAHNLRKIASKNTWCNHNNDAQAANDRRPRARTRIVNMLEKYSLYCDICKLQNRAA